MADAGFTSYRFSIAWPRIYPDNSGVPNQLGIDFYNQLIDELVCSWDYQSLPCITMTCRYG